MRSRRWDDLTPAQQRAIVAAAIATSVWQAVMLWDVWRRPAEQIRGSKRRWVIASFVRPFGQIAYYGWGRRTDPDRWFDDVGPDELAG